MSNDYPLPEFVMLEARKDPSWDYVKLLLVDKKHNCDMDSIDIPLTQLQREKDLGIHVEQFKQSLLDNGVI